MAGQGISLLGDVVRPRRYGFALTPLADAMFQLLIFFMLSSTLSPYSLISLTGGAPAGQSSLAATPDTGASPLGAEQVIWQLSRGQVRSGDHLVALSDLRLHLAEILPGQSPDVLIFPTRSATVQDIATVLEFLGGRGITKVRLVSGSQVEGG